MYTIYNMQYLSVSVDKYILKNKYLLFSTVPWIYTYNLWSIQLLPSIEDVQDVYRRTRVSPHYSLYNDRILIIPIHYIYLVTTLTGAYPFISLWCIG